jgi:hypothetical protein
MNFLIGCCLLLTGSFRVFYIGDISLVSLLFLWVGVSLLSNCSPSFEDALSLKDCLYRKETNIALKIILSPFFAVAYVSAYLERYCITFLLSIIFAWVFPTIFSFAFPIINQLLN